MARHFFTTAGLLMGAILTGCGGGGASGGGGGGQPPPTIPTLSAISPSTTSVGAPALTLSLYGSNFNQDSFAVLWNGTPLPAITTTWVSSTVLTATVPAANLASVGTAQVSVVNGSFGGGTSTSGTQTFTIVTPPAGTTWVRQVAGVATPRDVVWDAVHGNLYVSVAASDPVIPNTVVSINPMTGVAGTPVATGNDPNFLSISSDSSYLWVSLDGDSSIQRFMLANLASDLTFPLPVDWVSRPQQAISLQAAPVSPHTMAVVAGHKGWSPPGDGVYIFDDAVQRPVYEPGVGAEGGIGIDWIQWGADDSIIYGNGFGAPVDTLPVNSSGVTVENVADGDVEVGISQFVASTGLVYSQYGAYSPSNSSLVGSFDLPLPGPACTADASLGRYYCVDGYPVGGGDIQRFELWVYDLNSYALVGRVLFGVSAGGPPSSITGQPVWMVRWGKAGLAVSTIDDTYLGKAGFFLIDGAAVNPNVAPDVSSGTAAVSYSWMTSLSPQQVSATNTDLTVTINGTNFAQDSAVCYDPGFSQQQYLPTTYVSSQQLKATIPASLIASSISTAGPIRLSVFDPGTNTSSTNALAVTVGSVADSGAVTALNLAGLALTWDNAHQLLYVGVADWDGAYPNSILTLDGSTGAIVNGRTVAADPDLMSISAGGQYLYAGFAGSTNMTQFQLPGLGSPLTWGLVDPATSAVFYAGDLKAAPQSPHTTAAVLLNLSAGSPEVGVVTFDDNVVRPEYAPSWAGVPIWYDTVAWGPSDDILTGAPSNVVGGGPLYEFQVSPSGVAPQATGTAAFNTGTMHSDFGTGLIYSDDGNVGDPNTLAIVGSYAASGLVLPDSTLNRVFILGQTASQTNTSNFTIQAFNEQSYGWTAQIVLNSLLGFPVALARWGTSGLAVLTMNGGSGPAGMLYLIQAPNLVSDASRSGLQAPPELVQRRWRAISKSDIVRRIKKRKTRKAALNRTGRRYPVPG
jgi:hypothetical protein